MTSILIKKTGEAESIFSYQWGTGGVRGKIFENHCCIQLSNMDIADVADRVREMYTIWQHLYQTDHEVLVFINKRRSLFRG
jgi:hypothetical protein